MTAEVTDQDLLVSYQQGDLEAFEQLYDRHAQRTLTYLIGMLRDRDLAEEVLQRSFVSLVERSPHMAESTDIRAYLFATARNQALNLLRSKRRRRDAKGRYGILMRRRRERQDPSRSAASEEDLCRQLNDALNELPDGEREVVLLRTQGELTFDQIAEALRIPLGTASTRYQNALRRMRKCLADE